MAKEQILIDFGLKIRVLREARNMSQEALAAESGLDRSYMGGVERGERNIGFINIVKIAKALKVPLSTLFADLSF